MTDLNPTEYAVEYGIGYLVHGTDLHPARLGLEEWVARDTVRKVNLNSGPDVATAYVISRQIVRHPWRIEEDS